MKKVLAVIAAAFIFGGVAGGTILGINYLGNRNMTQQTTEADTSENTQEETKKAPSTNIAKSSSSSSSDENYRLDVSDIVEGAMPSVVSITNTMVVEQQGYSSLFDYLYGSGKTQEYEVPASGSGVILEKTNDELLIVTNNHVIEDSKELTVTFIDGSSADANVKGYDSTIDLAVVAVPLSSISDDTMKSIKVATYHDSDDLKVGQGVIAIGNALGYGQTVTVGYISALNREITAENTTYSDLIQTDAAINPGNSGGALINMNGEVIGINVAKLSSTQVEGFGYSIPIYKVMDVIENLSTAKTKVEVAEENRGRLGIYMNTISKDNATALGIPAGVIIKGFSDEYVDSYGLESVQESPARQAGLLKNDIITKFDGQGVSSAEDLSKLVAYYEKGSKVSVTFERLENGSYKEHTAEVTLGSRNDKVISPVNADEVPANAGRQGRNGIQTPDNKNGSNNGNQPLEPRVGGGAPQPYDDDENENEIEDNEDDSEDSSRGSSSDSEDMYELFREFLEQYQ